MSQQVRRSTRLQLKEQQAEEEGKRREPPSAAEEAEIAAPKRQPAKPKAPPSRKRSASAKKQEQEDAAMQAQSEEEEEQAPPAKKGKKGAATKQKKGKKASSKIAVEDLVAAEGGELPKPAAKPRAPRARAITEAAELEDGFIAQPPSLLYKAFGEQNTASTKIAAFDFDETLVTTKSGMAYTMGPTDWVLYNDQVVPKLRQYAQDGYRIVIFTNQGGIKGALDGKASSNFRQRVSAFMRAAGVPAVVLAATQRDELRKPHPGMWDFYVDTFMEGLEPDMSQSFYVGDNEDGESDEGFAASTGLAYRDVQDEFGAKINPKSAAATQGDGATPARKGGVEIMGTGVGPNADLVNVFETLERLMIERGESVFKARAYAKVAGVLQAYPHKVTPERVKDVSKLQGVGKSSIKHIKEFLERGTLSIFEEGGEEGSGGGGGGAGAGPRVGAPMEAAAHRQALQFM